MLTRDLFAAANILVGVISELGDRFDQSGIVTYKLVEFVLLRAFYQRRFRRSVSAFCNVRRRISRGSFITTVENAARVVSQDNYDFGLNYVFREK